MNSLAAAEQREGQARALRAQAARLEEQAALIRARATESQPTAEELAELRGQIVAVIERAESTAPWSPLNWAVGPAPIDNPQVALRLKRIFGVEASPPLLSTQIGRLAKAGEISRARPTLLRSGGWVST